MTSSLSSQEYLKLAVEIFSHNGLLVSVNDLIADDKLHRCATATHPRKKNGAYLLHLPNSNNKYATFFCRNWETDNIDHGLLGTEEKFEDLSKDEQNALKKKWKADQQKIKQERQQQCEKTADKVATIYNHAKKTNHFNIKEHNYLRTKQVLVYGKITVTDFSRNATQHNYTLVLPFEDFNGKIWYLQYIFQNGNKRFNNGRQQQGCFYHIPAKNNEQNSELVLAEGYATGATIREATGLEVLVVGSVHKLLEVAEIARKKYPHRKIVIAVDYDGKDGGIGFKKANEIRRNVKNIELAIPPVIDDAEDKRDWNDVYCSKIKEQGKEQALQIIRDQFIKRDIIPNNFENNTSGLYCYKKAGKDKNGEVIYEKVRLGDALYVTSQTSTQDKEDWGILVSWQDQDQHTHEKNFTNNDLSSKHSEWFAQLSSGGYKYNADPAIQAEKYIKQYLIEYQSANRAILLDQIGFTFDRQVFCLPNKTYSKNIQDKFILRNKDNNYNLYTQKGSLNAWCKLTELAIGNNALIFSLLFPFTAPLLNFAEMNSIIFSLTGSSSCGKTTYLKASASACSSYRQYIRTWRTTDNALETIATLHNDTLLVMDELGEVDALAFSKLIYMVGNEQGKIRAKKDGGNRNIARWKTLVLSSGEVGLQDKLNEINSKAKAGQTMRFIVIPVEACDLKELHDCPDVETLLQEINQIIKDNYGIAFDQYMNFLIQNIDEVLNNIKNNIIFNSKIIIAKVCEKYFPPMSHTLTEDNYIVKIYNKVDGQVRRIAEYFALLEYAGNLATQAGIFPHACNITQAIYDMFARWIDMRGVGSHEEQAILDAVRNFIEQHGQSHFITKKKKSDDLNDDDDFDSAPLIKECAGRRYIDGNKVEFQFFRHYLFGTVLKGFNEKQAISVLDKNGWLVKYKDDKGNYSYSKPVWLQGGTKRLYCIILPNDSI